METAIMAAEQHNLPNPPETSGHARHAATFAAAPLRDLITCARVFYATINSGGGRFSDDEMGVLCSFDDFLGEAIASRRPETAEDFATKAHYLISRVEADTLSDAAEAAAMEAIKSDAAMVAELTGREVRA
jgi:hypothetical protein